MREEREEVVKEGRLAIHYAALGKALESLHDAINLLECMLQQPQAIFPPGIDYETLMLCVQDALVWRFKYSVDLTWKYLKNYLETEVKIIPEVLGPKHIIRAAAKAALISEKEAEMLMEMVEARNQTSHIYRQEVAELISSATPAYYETMLHIIQRLPPK